MTRRSKPGIAKDSFLQRLTVRHMTSKIRNYFTRRSDYRDHELHQGLVLPPRHLRTQMSGIAFASNDFFLQSAEVEASRLVETLAYTKGSFVVDIGSGLGRLALGMLCEVGHAKYLGLEANREFVAWCQRHISRYHPSYRFVHIDVVNELYNPGGTIDGDRIELPVETRSADVVYLWGLFTNLEPDQARIYISEISRIVRNEGRIFLTAFVEDDPADVVVNPTNYVPYVCSGPLHVVRYSKDYLFSLFAKHGLLVTDFRHHGGTFPKQSEIYLQKQ